MDIGDLNTFVTNPKAVTNIMTATPLSIAIPEYTKEAFSRIVKAHVKARSRIVKVLGDYYYEELDGQECLDSQIVILPDGQLKTKEDVERFISEEIGKPLPLDRPQWRVWAQRKYLDDQKGIVIWKSHHSLADGVSSMAFNLQLDTTYDINKLIPFKEIGFMQRCFVRALVPFYIPVLLYEAALMRKDRNPLHDGKRKLTGEKRVVMSKEFDFKIVKDTSRALGCTINEVMIAALSMATAHLFKDHGDKTTKRMRIAVPCNIRWKYYETYEDVKMENKFAPMPMKVDIESDPEKAL